MKRFLYYLFTLIGVFWFQVVLDQWIGGSWFYANVVLITVLYFGLSRGPLVGQFFGFGWGLLLDASTSGLLGLNALLYALAGYLAGIWSRQLDESKIYTQSIFSFTMSSLYVLFFAGLDRLFSHGDRPFQWGNLSQPFMNAWVAPLVFWLLQRWSRGWAMNLEER